MYRMAAKIPGPKGYPLIGNIDLVTGTTEGWYHFFLQSIILSLFVHTIFILKSFSSLSQLFEIRC